MQHPRTLRATDWWRVVAPGPAIPVVPATAAAVAAVAAAGGAAAGAAAATEATEVTAAVWVDTGVSEAAEPDRRGVLALLGLASAAAFFVVDSAPRSDPAQATGGG